MRGSFRSGAHCLMLRGMSKFEGMIGLKPIFGAGMGYLFVRQSYPYPDFLDGS